MMGMGVRYTGRTAWALAFTLTAKACQATRENPLRRSAPSN
jgi:hypothetical protein